MEDEPEKESASAPRKRQPETDQQRKDRLQKNARNLEEAETAADDAVDAMIKKSLDWHGP